MLVTLLLGTNDARGAVSAEEHGQNVELIVEGLPLRADSSATKGIRVAAIVWFGGVQLAAQRPENAGRPVAWNARRQSDFRPLAGEPKREVGLSRIQTDRL